ncbi:hypothetical protein IIE_04813 [Bacillus cereus VD045]|nr:hypothetical protein IIE_04813 [Bacillus cereus VD045]HDR4350699.1 HAMP domain-containing histidine kinase [Bacillus cereus]
MAEVNKESIRKERQDEFITNISHDLRTPLTSIMGYLRLLRDVKYDNKEQHDEYIKIAFSKSEQLKNLIESLFEYTKLTNENVVLKKQSICMNDILDQLIKEVLPQAEERSLSFVKEFPDEQIYAVVDSEKIIQVFNQLLMNAIKYSEACGVIKVSLQRHQNTIQIIVENPSEYLTEKELKSLFEPLYKKDQSRGIASGSSGMGLAFAKNILNLQGGDICPNYKDGMIRFIISLPMSAEL